MAEVHARKGDGSVLSGEKKTGNFDVRSWQGLTSVLGAARSAGMSGEEYAAFRDSVLSYAQSGGTDSALRKKIEEKTRTFGIEVPQREAVAEKVTPEAERPLETSPQKTVPSFGRSRNAPTFGEKISEVQSVPLKKEVVEHVPPAPVPETPIVAPQKSEVAPKPSLPEKPVATPVVEEVPTQTFSIEGSKARIEEIKHIIASEIGNPAALLDETDDVGREYMQALVAAMKAVSGAAPGTLGGAMRKLEEVFPRVREAARMHREAKTNPTPEPEPIKEPEPTPPPAVSPEPEIVPPPPPEPIIMTEPEPIPPPVAPQEPEPQPAEILDTSREATEPLPSTTSPHEEDISPRTDSIAAAYERAKASLQHATPEPSVPSEVPPIMTPEIELPEEVEAETQPEPVGAVKEVYVPPAPAREPIREPLPKVRVEEEQKPSSTSLPSFTEIDATPLQKKKEEVFTPPVPPVTASQKEEIVSKTPIIPPRPETRRAPVTPSREIYQPQDELHTAEIDAGLREVINTWSIFRGGGFFGIGKSGMESPLWEKLKDAPMTVVATGRWDGADQEEIFSMRDYISGWRNEQGIWYVPTETFEMYLRRVVKRVLERAKH